MIVVHPVMAPKMAEVAVPRNNAIGVPSGEPPATVMPCDAAEKMLGTAAVTPVMLIVTPPTPST